MSKRVVTVVGLLPHLKTEWAKTVKPVGDCGMRHYPYEKLVRDLVDMHQYAGTLR